MVKTITIIGFLSLAVAFNSYAHYSDRIDQLRKNRGQRAIVSNIRRD